MTTTKVLFQYFNKKVNGTLDPLEIEIVFLTENQFEIVVIKLYVWKLRETKSTSLSDLLNGLESKYSVFC